RYEVAPGVWRDELRTDQPFLRYTPAQGIPKETAALAVELDRHPAPQAALDLHQDNFIHGALFYAYIFGDPTAYRPLLPRARARSSGSGGAASSTGGTGRAATCARTTRGSSSATTAASPIASPAPAPPTRPRSRPRPRRRARSPTRSTSSGSVDSSILPGTLK